MPTNTNYLDWLGLRTYDALIKEYMEGVVKNSKITLYKNATDKAAGLNKIDDFTLNLLADKSIALGILTESEIKNIIKYGRADISGLTPEELANLEKYGRTDVDGLTDSEKEDLERAKLKLLGLHKVASSGSYNDLEDKPIIFGASGTNHSSGLVPDPGTVQGSTKYLREDGTWAEPSLGDDLVYFSDDTGQGVVPSDGIKAETRSAGAAISVNPDVVTVVSGAVGTSTITLQVPDDNLAHVWDILMTTDSSVDITFATSTSAPVKLPIGFSMRTDKTVEISIVGVGNLFCLRYGEFN